MSADHPGFDAINPRAFTEAQVYECGLCGALTLSPDEHGYWHRMTAQAMVYPKSLSPNYMFNRCQNCGNFMGANHTCSVVKHS